MKSEKSSTRFVLGRGRAWDGFPVPQHIAQWLWSPWDSDVDSERAVPTRIWDLYWCPDVGRFIVLTDVEGTELCERHAPNVWQCLVSKGYRPKSIKRAQALTVYKHPRSMPRPDAPEPGAPNKLMTPGQQRRWERADASKSKRRAQDRKSARVLKNNPNEE